MAARGLRPDSVQMTSRSITRKALAAFQQLLLLPVRHDGSTPGLRRHDRHDDELQMAPCPARQASTSSVVTQPNRNSRTD
jgi:hypothetical protein